MDKFQVKKVENCFKDSQTYEYKINMEINDINSYVSTKIESTLGELKGQVIK